MTSTVKFTRIELSMIIKISKYLNVETGKVTKRKKKLEKSLLNNNFSYIHIEF